MRLLFVEEFKKDNPKYSYSIETPTKEKYRFGETYEEIIQNIDIHKTSASLDMCVFKRNSNKYERVQNIEFKHKNTSIKNIGKDVLKLLREEQNGAFILLLNNTNSGTLCNKNTNRMGIFNKFYKSFTDFKANWNNVDKSIQLLILSLKEEVLIHRKINKTDLNNLQEIFFINNGCENITEIKENGWNIA